MKIMGRLGSNGYHGAKELPEGAVWRVERNKATGKRGETKRVVDFLVKYVRSDKVDGKYLPDIAKQPPIWNWFPNCEKDYVTIANEVPAK